MKPVQLAVLVLVCTSFLVIPVFSEQPDEEEILEEVRNLSLQVPPAGSSPYGSKESMTEYQSWLDVCSERLMGYSNSLMAVFGLPAFGWPSGHEKAGPSASSGTAPAAPASTPPATQPPIKPGHGLTTIATITGGAGSNTTSVMVPYGYWELWYTAEPLVTGGQDSHSARGSNSAVFPVLKMEITESETGDEFETVEPPGGLDSYLWRRDGDPRPWSQKFYRGYRDLTFDITARHVKSYAIEIRVKTSDYEAQPKAETG